MDLYPKLSVIMPAYNAERYIERSVRSILEQSYRELELIVVDDGSSDQTGSILDRMAREDGRLKPLHVANGGPAKARSLGLRAISAHDGYVMFADADDELLPDALSYAVEGAQGADLVFFGFTIINAGGDRRDYFEPEQLIDSSSIGEAFPRLYKANLFNQVWGKLFKAQLLKDGPDFPDYRWGEDRIFIFRCLKKADSLKILPECKYNYIIHPGESLISRFYDKKPQVCLEADREVQELCRRFSVDAQGEAVCRYMFAKSIFSCMTNLFSGSCPLDRKGKRSYVASIIGDPAVKGRCERVFGGAVPSLLCALVRSGNVSINMAAFRMIATAGRLSPRLFTKLKHKK